MWWKRFFPRARRAIQAIPPSLGWDGSGNLNAMKTGTAVITAAGRECAVTVATYTDGTEIVGRLKLLARFNDSMQFYDGHVYLLFTSYQDGVTINVPDLYAGYTIADQYYTDIQADIANGSNHTGKDADAYFTLSKEMTGVTLKRGQNVTIGMYRDFDLTVAQAALGSIQNSSLWANLEDAGKTTMMENFFSLLDKGVLSTDQVLARFQALCADIGADYTKLLDGTVNGGVCFNRELYNQKLEWDQYENITYELDITRKQLNALVHYLGGNLNRFSMVKNSCATVALRAWNAAVGTRNGKDTAYKLSASGEGIYAVVDAPKGVRDNMVARLPGYYLNNAQGVAEPDAGFQDETGWVYVSAPEKVDPVVYLYPKGASIQIDEAETNMAGLVRAAKEYSSSPFTYGQHPQITVGIETAALPQGTQVRGVSFTMDGKTVSLSSGAKLPGVWFRLKADAVAQSSCCVVDENGKPLPSIYKNGWISFYTASLPVTYQL